ncbi:hypothetical protein UFOVP1454_33 [uncultured Caudovirales phage]|uniref:Uncharacterized protein n=1 Tax=uncultured Caudovirales phage TaxID=2100421 RepID=A0A6J5SJ20_9CAUD|nr:hypothetical protein UFOVP1454_33 [uncultured Caudovirales phage]
MEYIDYINTNLSFLTPERQELFHELSETICKKQRTLIIEKIVGTFNQRGI